MVTMLAVVSALAFQGTALQQSDEVLVAAASNRSSSGLSGSVSEPSFGTRSFWGGALVVLATSLSTARARILG